MEEKIADAVLESGQVEDGKLEVEVKTAVKASSLDPTVLLNTYIQANIQEMCKGPVDTAELLDRVTVMLQTAGCKKKVNPSFLSLSHQLKKYFGTTEIMTYRFSDGSVRHATVFKPQTMPDDVQQPTINSNKLAYFFQMQDKERGAASPRNRDGSLG